MGSVSSLNIKIDAVALSQPKTVVEPMRDVPIENNRTEGAGVAGTTEEKVPELVAECRSLRIRGERVVGAVTTEGDSDDASLVLASLNIGTEGLAVQQGGSGEGGATTRLREQQD